MPDNAVLKADEDDGYAFDLDYCKGCGICVVECPCGAIEMVPETICAPGEHGRVKWRKIRMPPVRLYA